MGGYSTGPNTDENINLGQIGNAVDTALNTVNNITNNVSEKRVYNDYVNSLSGQMNAPLQSSEKYTSKLLGEMNTPIKQNPVSSLNTELHNKVRTDAESINVDANFHKVHADTKGIYTAIEQAEEDVIKESDYADGVRKYQKAEAFISSVGMGKVSEEALIRKEIVNRNTAVIDEKINVLQEKKYKVEVAKNEYALAGKKESPVHSLKVKQYDKEIEKLEKLRTEIAPVSDLLGPNYYSGNNTTINNFKMLSQNNAIIDKKLAQYGEFNTNNMRSGIAFNDIKPNIKRIEDGIRNGSIDKKRGEEIIALLKEKQNNQNLMRRTNNVKNMSGIKDLASGAINSLDSDTIHGYNTAKGIAQAGVATTKAGLFVGKHALDAGMTLGHHAGNFVSRGAVNASYGIQKMKARVKGDTERLDALNKKTADIKAANKSKDENYKAMKQADRKMERDLRNGGKLSDKVRFYSEKYTRGIRSTKTYQKVATKASGAVSAAGKFLVTNKYTKGPVIFISNAFGKAKEFFGGAKKFVGNGIEMFKKIRGDILKKLANNKLLGFLNKFNPFRVFNFLNKAKTVIILAAGGGLLLIILASGIVQAITGAIFPGENKAVQNTLDNVNKKLDTYLVEMTQEKLDGMSLPSMWRNSNEPYTTIYNGCLYSSSYYTNHLNERGIDKSKVYFLANYKDYVYNIIELDQKWIPNPAAGSEIVNYINANGGLNLRDAASEDAKRILTMPKGAAVVIESNSLCEDTDGNPWVKARYKNYSGYCRFDYLTTAPITDKEYTKVTFTGPTQSFGKDGYGNIVTANADKYINSVCNKVEGKPFATNPPVISAHYKFIDAKGNDYYYDSNGKKINYTKRDLYKAMVSLGTAACQDVNAQYLASAYSAYYSVMLEKVLNEAEINITATSYDDNTRYMKWNYIGNDNVVQECLDYYKNLKIDIEIVVNISLFDMAKLVPNAPTWTENTPYFDGTGWTEIVTHHSVTNWEGWFKKITFKGQEIYDYTSPTETYSLAKSLYERPDEQWNEWEIDFPE